MAKTKFKNHYNSEEEKGEINLEPSSTIPDQTMPISEIMRRFVHGLPLAGQKVSFYTEDEDDEMAGIDIEKLDLSEIQELKEEAKQNVAQIQKQLKKQEGEKRKRSEAIPTESSEQRPDNPNPGKNSPAGEAKDVGKTS